MELDSEPEVQEITVSVPARSPSTPARLPLPPSASRSQSRPRSSRSAQSTPSRSPRKPVAARAQGARRAVPCVGCVRSAIAGRSSGECFDNKSGGNRCFRCSSGHICRALPTAAAAICTKFVNARINRAPRGVILPFPSLATVDLMLTHIAASQQPEICCTSCFGGGR